MEGEKTGAFKNDRDARCPFFRAHGADFIQCEGEIPDTKSRAQFGSQKEKELHFKVFCANRWQNCEHARSVKREKYEEE